MKGRVYYSTVRRGTVLNCTVLHSMVIAEWAHTVADWDRERTVKNSSVG